MEHIIAAGILCMIALVSLILSIRSFCKKGFLLNNAYIFATRQERETMDWSPYYRQSGVILFLIALIFLLNAISVLCESILLSVIIAVVMIFTAIYAIASSIKIERSKTTHS